MTHATSIAFSPHELAEQLSDLRYDALTVYLRALATKLYADAWADVRRERSLLGSRLIIMAKLLNKAADAADEAWQICAPHMETAKGDLP